MSDVAPVYEPHELDPQGEPYPICPSCGRRHPPKSKVDFRRFGENNPPSVLRVPSKSQYPERKRMVQAAVAGGIIGGGSIALLNRLIAYLVSG